MNDYGEDNPYCYFHPKEVLVGVCALCLKERLLVLASKQGRLPLAKDTQKPHRFLHQKLSVTLPKVFALGSILHRLEFRQRKFEHSDRDTLSSNEDSFISIQFEDNGRASWNIGTSFKPPMDPFELPCDHSSKKEATGAKSVVEHAKPRATLRWGKRMGHLFQLIRWQRSCKANGCHGGTKVDGVKIRKGWIRSVTKRRTIE